MSYLGDCAIVPLADPAVERADPIISARRAHFFAGVNSEPTFRRIVKRGQGPEPRLALAERRFGYRLSTLIAWRQSRELGGLR